VYLAGEYGPQQGDGAELANCLVTNNRAGRDGAGVSANWQVKARISNCTIADNQLTRIPGYGAGLYCSYGSDVNVIDSIIWGNYGSNGSQIGVASGDPAYPMPSRLKVSYSDIQVFQAAPTTPTPQETGEPADACVPDYHIYTVLDTSEIIGQTAYGAHALDGWIGDDGVDRIIFLTETWDPNAGTSSISAYIVKVTVPEGTNPQSHPNNPFMRGPIAERTFEVERYFDCGEHDVWPSTVGTGVDVENNVIYIGPTWNEGVLKYVFDSDANNPVDGGPPGNYVFDSVVAPPPPVGCDTFAYDPENQIFYAGSWGYEIYSYDATQGANGNWQLAFTSFRYGTVPPGYLEHHDGLAFANGHLYLADMFGDWVLQYTPDGTLVNAYYHKPFIDPTSGQIRDLEGMGWGAFNHFWSGSFGGQITEFGGGKLQQGLGGVTPVPPIYVETGCVLEGWQPADANDFMTWDVNSWDANTHNIDADPCFVAGYYLSQPVEGRPDEPLSPCVDAGSDLAVLLGMDLYNTRIDGVNDVDIVDMGYHYDNDGLPRHHLTVTVLEDPNDPGIHGRQRRGHCGYGLPLRQRRPAASSPDRYCA